MLGHSDVHWVRHPVRQTGNDTHWRTRIFFPDLRVYSGTLSYLPEDAATTRSPPAPEDFSASGDPLPKPSTDLLVPLGSPVPATWTVIDGEFISVYIASISRLGVSNVGIPWAKLDDGLVYIFWVRAGAPKSAVASFLINLGKKQQLRRENRKKDKFGLV